MSFQSLGLTPPLLKATDALDFTTPTEVQRIAIPHIFNKRDLGIEAQTGTGKTAAFALPVVQLISQNNLTQNELLALTLVPTRELAIQVASTFKACSKYTPQPIKVLATIGGEPIEQQLTALRAGVNILVSTPGRLLDLIERKAVSLSQVQLLILDEADKLLALGFAEALHSLLKHLPQKRQNILLSATLSDKVLALSSTFLDNPLHLQVRSERGITGSITQQVFQVDRDKRRMLLQHLLQHESLGHCLVFVASRRAADNLAAKLHREGVSVAAFHGGLEQRQRNTLLRDFRAREIQVLIATDMAARGIDIKQLNTVVNYDLPRSPLDYVHRIGRTGRANESGRAISFVDHETEAHLKLIEKRANIRLERQQFSGFELSGVPVMRKKGPSPTKGKRKSKKDKLREGQAEAE